MVEGGIHDWNAIAPRLQAFVRKRISDGALAQDIVQDVFIQFHLHGHQLKDQGKLTGWIFRVARNQIVDFYRNRKWSRIASAIPLVAEENRTQECVSECIKEEIERLPEKYKRPLEKAELQGVPQVRLALEWGLSYSGLKSRVQRAKELLRRRMKQKYYIEHDRYGNIQTCLSRRGNLC